MNKVRASLPLLLCVLALTSCKVGSNPLPASFSDGVDLSAGKLDPKLVGVWKSPEETYQLAKDGTFKMHYDRMVSIGPSSKAQKTGDIAGKWSVLEDTLLMNVTAGENNSKHKLNFRLEKGGKELELRQPFAPNKPGVVYRRSG